MTASLLVACSAQPSTSDERPPASFTLADNYADTFQHGAVACDHAIASQAGLEMLLAGGNAVDATVAASFCLSVVRPYSCGIGGGGFMIIHEPGDERRPARAIALNYRESAPSAVGPDYYVNLKNTDKHPSRFGVHAVAVPGTVRGLLFALEHYGTMDRATVLAPAIRAAELGFAADASFISAVGQLRTLRDERPHTRATSAYFWNTICKAGDIEPGDRITNPQQARALRLIARHGDAAFYTGPIAAAVTSVMSDHRGPMTAQDLASYSMRIEMPLRGSFLGREILAMPPPSSGGVAQVQIFGMLQQRIADVLSVDATRRDPLHPDYIHLLTEAMKHAFADRAEYLADDDFVEVPIERLTDTDYVNSLAESISLQHTQERFSYGSVSPAPADSGTSHLSVIDSSGMAVACTETINTRFGSCVEVPGFGFMLNNEMDDFTTMPGEPNVYGLRQSDANLPAPGKRPLSSMSPTIVLRDGRVELIAGASGGPRIISGTVQAMLNCLLFDMQPAEAVAAPRFHHQWMPDVLQFEDQWRNDAVIEAMQQRGHDTGWRDEIGVVQLIRISPDGIRAASDPRKGGEPAGY